MPEPVTITLASVGGVVISEGIKFLYGQAADLLRRWRERADKLQKGEAAPKEVTVGVDPPEALDHGFFEARVDLDELGLVRTELLEFIGQFAPYVTGAEDLPGDDQTFLERVAALRSLISSVYGRPLRFRGEPEHEADPPEVLSLIEAKEVAGKVIGIRTDSLQGRLRSEQRFGHITQTADVLGVEIRTRRETRD